MKHPQLITNQKNWVILWYIWAIYTLAMLVITRGNIPQLIINPARGDCSHHGDHWASWSSLRLGQVQAWCDAPSTIRTGRSGSGASRTCALFDGPRVTHISRENVGKSGGKTMEKPWTNHGKAIR